MFDLFRIIVTVALFIFYLGRSYSTSEFTTSQKFEIDNSTSSDSPPFVRTTGILEVNTLQSSIKHVNVSNENLLPTSTLKNHFFDEHNSSSTIIFTQRHSAINASYPLSGKHCNESLSKILAVANNCSLYYETCHHEQKDSESNQESITKLIKSCSNGYLFDSIDVRCVPKAKAFCGVFNCTKPDGFFPDPKDRKYFIACYDSKPRRKRCEPLGTVYDKDLQVCIRAPEELPTGLKLLKLFLWFVVATEQQQYSRQNCHSIFKSTEDLAKLIAIAVFIPCMWLVTVVGLYLEIQTCRKNEDCDVFLDDDEEYNRYLPMSANITTPELRTRLELLARTNISRCNSNSHFATTTF